MPKWHAGLIELKLTLSEQLNLTEMDYDDRSDAERSKVEPESVELGEERRQFQSALGTVELCRGK